MAEEPVNGREAINAMFEKEFAHADMHCIIENLFEDGEWAILDGRTRWDFGAAAFFT